MLTLVRKSSTMRDALRAYRGWAPDLKPRTFKRMKHDLNRAIRVWGEDVRPENVTTSHFVMLRQTCIDEGAAVSTVENTVSTIWTLLRFLRDIGQLDHVPSKGRVLRRPSPRPNPPSVDEFDKLYRSVSVARWPRLVHNRDEWWKAFLATAYFTALRLSDLLAFEWEWIDDQGRIVIEAGKTGKIHIIPVHRMLARQLSWLPRVKPKVFHSAKTSLHQLRRELHRMSDAAGVKYIGPQRIRQLSANVWETARPGCGSLILGHGFRGATRHYLTAQLPLMEAVDNLNVPPGMLESEGKQLRLF